MNKEDYKALDYEYAPTVISSHFNNMNARTLLYGYNTDRSTLHIYLCERGFIHIHHYTLEHTIYYNYTAAPDIDLLIPNKRLYPECCDFEICKRLKKWGYNLPFTKFNNEREVKQFYGKVHEAQSNIA